MNEVSKLGLAIAVVLIMVLSIHSAFALSDEEVQNITNNVTFVTQQQINEQTNAINGNISSRLVGLNLTQEQINQISDIVSDNVLATVQQACNPYLLDNQSLANPLQKAMDGAISNAMDRKFIDQRQWIENTYIKTNDEFQQLRDEKNLCNQEKSILQSQYDTARISANYSLQACEADKKTVEERANSYGWVAMALALLIVLIATREQWAKAFINKASK